MDDAGKWMKWKTMEKRTPILEGHQGSDFDSSPGISNNNQIIKSTICIFSLYLKLHVYLYVHQPNSAP